MAPEPQTWHYGLIAQWWAEFKHGGPDIPYFQSLIERYGQPALDVACGTGRVLLPYLRAGLDVDGCDISPDMLALCRDKADTGGLTPNLYQQAMHELDLPRTYKTIFLCGSFGLGGNRDLALQALHRIHHHLEPGGVLAFDHELPYGDPSEWQDWLPENRSLLPHDWPPQPQPADRQRASDGTDYNLRLRRLDLDPLEQTLTLQMLAQRWRGEDLIEQEERTLIGSLYFKNEIVMMLQQAGFHEITINNAYTNLPATSKDTFLVFLATK